MRTLKKVEPSAVLLASVVLGLTAWPAAAQTTYEPTELARSAGPTVRPTPSTATVRSWAGRTTPKR